MYHKLATNLKKKGARGFSRSYLYTCKDLYLCYPQIFQSLTGELKQADFYEDDIFKSLATGSEVIEQTSSEVLINHLSFTHLVELIKQDQPLKRLFYETMSISNNWSVRELQRAISSMLYERTGLSENKQAVLESHQKGSSTRPEDFLRNPYVLEFLNIESKTILEESNLEGEIINHLQNFLLEMGKGFCFEERQKRITFDNTHYRIDLGILSSYPQMPCVDRSQNGRLHSRGCRTNEHVPQLLQENEMQQGDAPPIGIILCAGKSETLARYATAGLSQKVFVSKYLTKLPSEEQLQDLIRIEQEKAQ